MTCMARQHSLTGTSDLLRVQAPIPGGNKVEGGSAARDVWKRLHEYPRPGGAASLLGPIHDFNTRKPTGSRTPVAAATRHAENRQEQNRAPRGYSVSGAGNENAGSTAEASPSFRD